MTTLEHLLWAEAWDPTGQHIPHLLSRSASDSAVHFFDSRLGCVEVAIHGQLKRVMFALPSSCRQGGAMQSSQRLHDLMHKADWIGDREKKNWEFVHLLLELVDEERHVTRLQRSWLAFTVDYWWHICAISFGVTLLLHLLVIIGQCALWSPYLAPAWKSQI